METIVALIWNKFDTYDRYWVRPSSGETSEKFINRIKKCYNDNQWVSPSCQFDFHKNGGISVFCKDFSQPNCISKIFATNSYTGQIIAMKDCDKSLIVSGN